MGGGGGEVREGKSTSTLKLVLKLAAGNTQPLHLVVKEV